MLDLYLEKIRRTKLDNFRILFSVLVLISSICIGSAAGQTFTLEEAEDEGLVYVEFYGTGASSGQSIIMGIERLCSYPVELTIPSGMVLKSYSASYQDMVVRRAYVVSMANEEVDLTLAPSIKLVDNEPQAVLLEAYCLDFEKDNPGEDATFSIGDSGNYEVKKVMGAVEKLDEDVADIASIQTAIWVVTDDLSREELEEKFEVTQENIDNAEIILESAGIDPANKRMFQNHVQQPPQGETNNVKPPESPGFGTVSTVFGLVVVLFLIRKK